jgi:hypothetical protein
MSLQCEAHLSSQEWLAGERASLEGRNAYVGVGVFAMTAASAEHNAIVSNINR